MRLVILATFLLLTACDNRPVGNPNVPEPTKLVEVKRYLGKWYEIGRYENRFEEGCEAVTAEYGLLDDGKVSVLNSCHQGAVDGPLETADGKAKIVEGSGNAKLKVSFFGPFYVGNYWVLDHAKDYSWSIVGEPSGKYLWILARSPKQTAQQKEALWARAKALGYDTTLIREVKH